jgi:hypothetical protein
MTLRTQRNINKYTTLKEERVTTMRLDDLGKSTTLKSNKSLNGEAALSTGTNVAT